MNSTCFGLMCWSVSVSYTHLDVYKRQGYICPAVRESLQSFTLQRSKTTNEMGTGFCPVSYTHLELLTGVRKNGAPPSTTVTFAELPAPKQVSRNVAERCATLHIGSASLDIYSGCDAEQLKMLVELLRPC